MRATLCVMSVLLAALAAAPAETQNRDPDWLKKPTPENLFALWPPDALRKGQGGKATISCTVTVQGTLRACTVVSETPQGAGFGKAAIGLAPQFLMRPQLVDGKPVEGTVNIPINWSGTGPATGSYISSTLTDRVYHNLPFKQAPSQAEVLAAYPMKGRTEKVGGVVTLNCRILEGGGLGNCKPVREEPKGKGFADAARTLTPKFVGPVEDGNGGKIVGARTLVVVTFAAETLDSQSTLIGKPRWVQIPRVNDLEAVLPAAAKKAGVYKARVVMSCRVADAGAVQSCKTESEDPSGLGFGSAAESLSQYFRLTVWTEEGLPTIGGSVRIPLRFDLEPPAPETPKPGG